jgi:REP element-mobilizing transposase RayT
LQYAPNNQFIFKESQAQFKSPSQTIGSIIRGFKSAGTKQVNLLLNTPTAPFWQRNYYEHVIRDEDDYWRIYNYIDANPEKWQIG